MNSAIYSIDELRRLISPIAKNHGLNKVYLFGSYARGSATENSDVDLCIDASSLRGLFAIGTLYADLEDTLQKKLDIVTFGSLKYNNDKKFVNNLHKDEVLIYEYIW